MAHLSGIPRSAAQTMRDLLPISVPGKTLEECTPAEIIMLIMRRNQERAVNESHLPDGFISDGSSLHEWAYGTVRVTVGINPNDTTDLTTADHSDKLGFYRDVLAQMAIPAHQHAKATYDSFVHLPIEFPLVPDGHRPVNERFRFLADELMLTTLQQLQIPYHTVGGSITQRLQQILDLYHLTPQMSITEAITRARADYVRIDTTPETARPATIHPANARTATIVNGLL
ncbi:ATP-binding protein [Crossiella sp. S99.2]|nr:ATP-binding protein [Crossiella sp. S99.2]MCK2252729.1 ATP-binding protein [Crossiella sp. S99.1]